jgi:hypothetical protein
MSHYTSTKLIYSIIVYSKVCSLRLILIKVVARRVRVGFSTESAGFACQLISASLQVRLKRCIAAKMTPWDNAGHVNNRGVEMP